MAEIKFGDYSQRFEQFYNIFHIAAAVLCLIMGVFALIEEGRYAFLPPIFIIGAAVMGLNAYDRFSGSRRKKAAKRAGYMYLGLMVLLTAVSVVSAVCFWF
ncbi:MAG: hypothetical protein IJS22_09545 [Lachnospiraceae bacterium]|nr:hypothetical protein [Lachnospiraceae bacterium]